MTTVYIDKRINLVLTDSCVTSSSPRLLFGLFNLKCKNTRTVCTQKALYINDRLFVCAGNVGTINKVLSTLVDKSNAEFNSYDNCTCVYIINKFYCILFSIDNKKLKRRIVYMNDSFRMSFGSGSKFLTKIIKQENVITDEVLEEFKKIKDFDYHTDDNINLYKIF